MTPSHPVAPEDRPGESATRPAAANDVARLFDSPGDPSRVERLLTAYAVHPEGAGFETAWLLSWNPRRGLLEGRLVLGAHESLPLAQALTAARLVPGETTEPLEIRAFRAQAFAPERLAGVCARAWNGLTSGWEEAPPPASSGLGELAPPWADASAIGAIAFSVRDRGHALLVGSFRDAPHRDRGAALERLRGLGDAAFALHVESEDARRRTRQIQALAEFARCGVSPLNLAELFQHAARLAAQATHARGSALWRMSGPHALKLEATFGPAGTRERLARALHPLAGVAVERGRPVVVERVTDEPLLSPEAAAQLSAVVVLPLAPFGRLCGALAVYDRAAFHPADDPAFDRVDLDFLAAFADQAALMVEAATLHERLRDAERRREDTQKRLARGERLAALGEQAARVAHELRNPLASIAAFARRVHRSLEESDPNREYLEIVVREAERLERTMGEHLQFATLDRPRLRLESLNAVVQQALQSASERLVRRRVRLLKRLAPELPPLLIDGERIQRVIANILDNVLENVSPGGRVRVESRRVQQHVVVELASDGPHPPGDLVEQLFVPFATSRQGGGVGLAVAQEVVQQHGGEIRVRSEAEWTVIFSFTLPIVENQDRRRPGTERRATRTDRRRRYPAA